MSNSFANAPIILSVFTFYIFLGVVIGLIGQQQIITHNIGAINQTPSDIGLITQIGYFFSGIFYSLSTFPAWLNVVLFAPLGATLFYIFLVLIFP